MKRRRLCAFFLALLFGMVSSVRAADCQKTAESCVEGPETRNIGGYPVHRDCWRYRSQFSCVSQAMSDDCQPCATAVAASRIELHRHEPAGRLHAL
jgi:hypothetical protein